MVKKKTRRRSRRKAAQLTEHALSIYHLYNICARGVIHSQVHAQGCQRSSLPTKHSSVTEAHFIPYLLLYQLHPTPPPPPPPVSFLSSLVDIYEEQSTVRLTSSLSRVPEVGYRNARIYTSRVHKHTLLYILEGSTPRLPAPTELRAKSS